MVSKLETNLFEHTRIFQINECSILIQFEQKISEKTLQKILDLKQKICSVKGDHLLQVINTYHSLLLIYRQSIQDFENQKQQLSELFSEVSDTPSSERSPLKIPVCYNLEMGSDLQLLSEDLKLPVSEIIKRHTAPIYRVYFIGFMPGFPYLGGLDASLYHRRKSQPRRQISKGSVGIADQQTGIYPMASPGGWQIIGRTPVELFDKTNTNRPSLLSAGDSIEFVSITKEEFETWQSNPKSINSKAWD